MITAATRNQRMVVRSAKIGRSRLLAGPRSALLPIVLWLTLPFISANAQTSELVLPYVAEAQLDALASRVIQKIKMANLVPRAPDILVIDFTLQSPDQSSRLGTFLANHFSDLLSHYRRDLKVLDRKVLTDYLQSNWTRIEDLRYPAAALAVARELGATGIVRGTLVNEGNFELKISLQVSGLGPERFDEAQVPLTEDMQTLISEPVGPYFQESQTIPAEPGVLQEDDSHRPGVTLPTCISCPDAHYSEVSRASKIQGTVILSAIVTVEGKATSIYVLKSMPLGLTRAAINAVMGWQMKPALDNGKPVPIRVKIETTFRLL